jgi:hypothetical protein
MGIDQINKAIQMPCRGGLLFINLPVLRTPLLGKEGRSKEDSLKIKEKNT